MSNYLTGEQTEDHADELMRRAIIAQERIAASYEPHTRALEQLAANEAEAARQWRGDRRERIATAALSGLLGNGRIEATGTEFVRLAVSLADILIAELDKEPQP